MTNKKIAICRFAPFDINSQNYNVQEIGMAKAFCKRGYNVDLILFNSKEIRELVVYEKDDKMVVLKEIPRIRLFRWGYNRTLLDVDIWKDYDFVICFEYMQIMSYQIAKLTKKVILYSGPYYNLFFLKFISPIYDFFTIKQYNKCLLANYTKSVLAQQYLEKKGYENVNTIGVGLDIDCFDVNTKMSESTAKIVDFMNQNKCILYVGALSDRKNFPFMLKLYEHILKKDSSIKFVMIGKSVTSAFSKLLGKKAEDYAASYLERLPQQVKEGIYHVKSIDNPQLKFIYPLAKAFLLPSKQEIFGMVLLESLYLGAPVISSINGGSMTILDGKDSGIIVESFDVEKWRDAVLLYLNDDEYRCRVVTNGKKLIKDYYTWDSIVSKMLENVNHIKEPLCRNS